jgi:putative copper export protein
VKLSAFLAIICMLVPAIAFAHPGHGASEPDSWLHYLTEPVHVIPLAIAVSLAVITGLAWRRLRARQR